MARAWSTAEDALLRTLLGEGYGMPEIVRRFEENGVQRTRKAIERRKESKGWHAQVRPSPYQKIDAPLVIEGDTLVTADWHCPFHKASWLNRTAELALRWGVKKAAIIGDLADLSAFCIYGRNLGVEAEDEIQSTEQGLNAWADSFEEVGYNPGNHEQRLLRQLGYMLGIERVLNLWVKRPNVRTTRRKWMVIKSGGETFVIGHPKNFSRQPTYTARQVAARKKCHVLLAHNHIVGMARDASDSWWCIDTGMCADVERLAYVQDELTTLPEMQQGAVIIKDGVPVLLTPANIGLYEQMRM